MIIPTLQFPELLSKIHYYESFSGVVVYFNFADFKRQNSVLGYSIGDADIVAFYQVLARVLPDNSIFGRDGTGFVVYLPDHWASSVLENIIGQFYKVRHGKVHWNFIATAKNGERRVLTKPAVDERVIRTVRCVYGLVSQESPLDQHLADLLYEASFVVPVNTPFQINSQQTVEDLPQRTYWQAIENPFPERMQCPFCGSSDFDYMEGDGSFIGEVAGICFSCGAEVLTKTEFIHIDTNDH